MKRFSSVLLVALVLLALFAGSAEALCKCKKQNQSVGPCNVGINVCGCVKGIHWKYKATASASGVSRDYSWTKSGEGAAKEAIVRLFQSMSGNGMCNCQSGTIPFGKCAIQTRGCFYFASEGALNNKQATIKGIVTAPNGATYTVAHANGEQAVQSAMQAMLQAQPQLVQQCGVSLSEAMAFE